MSGTAQIFAARVDDGGIRRWVRRFDRFGIAISFAILALFGLATRGQVRMWPDLSSHLAGIVLAGILFTATEGRLKLAAIAVLCLLVLAVGLTFVPWAARSSFGASRWISVGRISMQPSELAKPGLLMAVATLGNGPRWRKILLSLAAAALIGMIAAQPDFGTAGLLFVLCCGVLLIHNLAAGVLTVVIGAAGLLIMALAAPHVNSRIAGYLIDDPRAGGYQTTIARQLLTSSFERQETATSVQAMDLLARLPSARSDFAIVSLAACAGGWCLLALLAMLSAALASRTLRLAAATGLDGTLAICGIGLLYLQIVVNASGVTGLIPVIGVPFPFLSAGGSSTVATWMILGLSHRQFLRRSLN